MTEPDNVLRVGAARIRMSELVLRFSRASGPGGQNVNKRSTRVEVFFDVAQSPSLTSAQRTRATQRLATRLDARGRIRVTSSAGRTQADNRERAIARLVSLLAEALRAPPRARVPTRPSANARARRVDEKKRRGTTKRLRSQPRDD
ncbi:MAG: alternative ribosome rescue aminoacyl-tRNA hydrolase ArfB [Actinomycetota bacterium]